MERQDRAGSEKETFWRSLSKKHPAKNVRSLTFCCKLSDEVSRLGSCIALVIPCLDLLCASDFATAPTNACSNSTRPPACLIRSVSTVSCQREISIRDDGMATGPSWSAGAASSYCWCNCLRYMQGCCIMCIKIRSAPAFSARRDGCPTKAGGERHGSHSKRDAHDFHGCSSSSLGLHFRAELAHQRPQRILLRHVPARSSELTQSPSGNTR